jgi:hypothetical protein
VNNGLEKHRYRGMWMRSLAAVTCNSTIKHLPRGTGKAHDKLTRDISNPCQKIVPGTLGVVSWGGLRMSPLAPSTCLGC